MMEYPWSSGPLWREQTGIASSGKQREEESVLGFLHPLLREASSGHTPKGSTTFSKHHSRD
jgi:hypothetical protein